MSKRKLIYITPILLVLFFYVQPAMYWRTAGKVLKDKDTVIKVSQVPKDIDLPFYREVNRVSWSTGFSEFYFPSDKHLKISYDDSFLFITSDIINITLIFPSSVKFLMPSENQVKSDIESSLSSVPEQNQIKKAIEKALDDPLELEIMVANTVPMTFSQIMYASKDEFQLYLSNLIGKASIKYGYEGIFFYESRYSKGIIRMGEKYRTGERVAHVSLMSGNKSMIQGLFAEVPDSYDGSVLDYLLPFIKEYRFIVNDVESDAQLITLIRQAGIQPRANGTR